MLGRIGKSANSPLGSTLIGVAVAAIITAWRWSDVRRYLASVWTAAGYLSGTVQVHRWALFALLLVGLLVLGLALALAVVWWRQRSKGFNPTAVQLMAMAVLLRRYDETTTLAQLDEELKLLTQSLGGKAFLARQMEDLERAHMVRVDRTGRGGRYYALSTPGRDWYLHQIKHAREHPEEGPEATHEAAPETTPQPAAKKFDPESFKLSPARCCALLHLSDRIDAITTLYELHKLITQGSAGYVDPETNRSQVQHDMEAAEAAGLVRIDRVGEYTHHYQLTIPDGRDWVITYQAHLRTIGRQGMKKIDPRSPLRFFR